MVAVFAGQFGADQWLVPQTKEVFSKSRDWFVRVVPGTSFGDANGFSGSRKRGCTRALIFTREAEIVDTA